MPTGAGLVLGLGTNGVATGGGTYPDDTCKEKQKGGMYLEEVDISSCIPSSPSRPRLSYCPAPYPGFEGIVLGHVIQQ